MSKSIVSKLKRCSKCHEYKPRSEFSGESRRPDGLRCFCRVCGAKQLKEYRQRPDIIKRKREHFARPEQLAYRRSYELVRKFGITLEEYDAMLASQHGLCALCGTDKPNGRWNTFHVDHCHETGVIRGLLCYQCNAALGRLGDNEEGIRRALKYVTRKGEIAKRRTWKHI